MQKTVTRCGVFFSTAMLIIQVNALAAVPLADPSRFHILLMAYEEARSSQDIGGMPPTLALEVESALGHYLAAEMAHRNIWGLMRAMAAISPDSRPAACPSMASLSQMVKGLTTLYGKQTEELVAKTSSSSNAFLRDFHAGLAKHAPSHFTRETPSGVSGANGAGGPPRTPMELYAKAYSECEELLRLPGNGVPEKEFHSHLKAIRYASLLSASSQYDGELAALLQAVGSGGSQPEQQAFAMAVLELAGNQAADARLAAQYLEELSASTQKRALREAALGLSARAWNIFTELEGAIIRACGATGLPAAAHTISR